MEEKNSWNDQKESLRRVGSVGVSSLTGKIQKQGVFAFAFSSAWLSLSLLLLTHFLMVKEMAVNVKYLETCIAKGI